MATEVGALTLTRTGPNEIAFKAPAHLAIVMFTAQPNREFALNSDQKTIALAPVGSIEVVPEDAELFSRWTAYKENLLIALDQDRLSELAGMEFENENFTLHPPKTGFVDHKALSLANMIRQEFQCEAAGNTLCFEALTILFGVHCTRRRQTPSLKRPGCLDSPE